MMEKNKLGMILFICSEVIFFSLLILAYLYFQQTAAANGGPTAANSLNPYATSLVSLFLFASSFTIWRAGKSLAHQHSGRFQFWLLATIGLGVLFLAGQGLEWRKLLINNTTVSSDLFGTTFFTLTGFHGLHVLVGLIALSILFGIMRTSDFKGASSPGVEALSLYWHFVDVVWVVIFSVIYLRLLL